MKIPVELRRCQAHRCSIHFIPKVPWQRYCSKACKHRAWYRRRYGRSPRYGTRYGTCPHGHDRSPENVYYRPDGSYSCRACNREKMAIKYRKDPVFRERRKNDERLRRLRLREAAA